jgi:hypothetical protein
MNLNSPHMNEIKRLVLKFVSDVNAKLPEGTGTVIGSRLTRYAVTMKTKTRFIQQSCGEPLTVTLVF